MIVPLALNLMSARSRQRLSILIYHRVLAHKDDLHTDLPNTAEFERDMGWVARWFNVLPLDVAVRRWRAGTLPARAAAITFDDGYADNLTQATPILRRLGLTATFFIATDYLDGGRMWNDTIAEAVRRCPTAELDLRDLDLGTHPLADMSARRAAVARLLPAAKYLPQARRQEVADAIAARVGQPLPDDLMMTRSQLKALRDAGMQIGAHTLSHPILANLSGPQAEAEIRGSKQELEALLQQPVTLFAYPNGVPGRDYRREHADMVEAAGFEAAVTTAAGATRPGSLAAQLPRFTPWDQTATRFGLRLARNLLGQEATH